MRKSVLADIKTSPCSLEREIMPGLAERGELLGTAARGSFIDIGIPDDFSRAQTLLPAYMKRPAAFLDRDGVLNRSIVRDGKPYPPASLAELEIVPEALDALTDLKAAGFLLPVVTNQPDAARGTQTTENIDAINARLAEALPLDGIYVCFHAQDGECECRKPKPGLLLQAAQIQWRCG